MNTNDNKLSTSGRIRDIVKTTYIHHTLMENVLININKYLQI